MTGTKVWSLDNCLSTPGSHYNETPTPEQAALLLDKLRQLIENEPDEIVWVLVDHYDE